MRNLLQHWAGLSVAALLAATAANGQPPIAKPYESDTQLVSQNQIDVLVRAKLEQRRFQPANLCSDGVFIRRAYLDVIGTLPTLEQVRGFIADPAPGKRAAVIETLLERKEFADYWALKWCDILRVKSEYPINLWPNAVQAFHRWIREAVEANIPYDRFARELLTSSGSNFRVPQVNFYRAVQGREPAAIASAVALTLMGARFDKWPEARRSGMQAFFSRVGYKTTAEWKEEIVCLDPGKTGVLTAVFPDGRTVRVADGEDPRAVFADWLVQPENPWFTRCIANRVWYWLMGRGIIQEPDDIRPDNPAANPELLAFLQKELVQSRYDLKQLCRLILNSATYQQSSIPRASPSPSGGGVARSEARDSEAASLSAHYLVRRLDAEVLIDALSTIFGPGEVYSSAIPEPFSFMPQNQRTIGLPDGSMTTPFLQMFGRPSRDTGLEAERNNQPTDEQRLHLLNSTHIQQKIERSPRLNLLIRATLGNQSRLIGALYLSILSRYPTEDEVRHSKAYIESSGLTQREAAVDLAWALINTKEFLYRH